MSDLFRDTLAVKKRTVLIDLDRLKDLNTGLGQFALQFGTAISQLDESCLQFTFLVPKQFNGLFGSSVQYENISLKRRYLPAACRHYDMWHSIHQDSAFSPSGRGTPSLLTIHDLNFLFEKDPCKADKRLQRLQNKVDRAEIISVISEFTRETVLKHLSLSNKELVVIHNGVEVREFNSPHHPHYVPGGEILFSIGVIQEKKNQKTLVEMMKHLPDNYSLVIAGNKTGKYAEELQDAIRNAKLEQRVILPGTITDEEKYWFFTHCKALLFPSKFEGFGIPPIEAMRLGRPVFASKLSSIPEICGEHAFYWEQFDPRYMANLLLDGLKLFESEPERAGRAIHHSLQFSWNSKVQNYVQLYKQLLGL
jgi:glycosyltransferase involved in cell wall biosynthesis